MADDPRGVVELIARESYGRLVAYLAARTRDVAAAEDALADAFLTALGDLAARRRARLSPKRGCSRPRAGG